MALLLRTHFIREKNAGPKEALFRVGIIQANFILTLAAEIGKDHPMEGEKKRASSRCSKGKKANLNPGPIQEYDFFVTRDGGDTKEAAAADHSIKAKKKGGRNKSTSFFLSD